MMNWVRTSSAVVFCGVLGAACTADLGWPRGVDSEGDAATALKTRAPAQDGTVRGGGHGDVVACCFDDETCADMSPMDCMTAGGQPQGMGSSCDATDCSAGGGHGGDHHGVGHDHGDGGDHGMGDHADHFGQDHDLHGHHGGDGDDHTGACCFGDGTCQDMLPMDCMLEGGMPLGMGTSCDTVECQVGGSGACCFGDGTCADLPSPMDCMLEGGYWQGWGSACDSTDCTDGGDHCGHGGEGHGGGHGGGGHGGHSSACCFADGTCADMPMMDCMFEGGMPFGPDSVCDEVDCSAAATSACCFDDGTCADLFPMDCMLQGGTPQEMGTTCGDVDCSG